jgi:hypothetical protein
MAQRESAKSYPSHKYPIVPLDMNAGLGTKTFSGLLFTVGRMGSDIFDFFQIG